MPAYNCEKYVERSIQSILRQSFKDFELIIVDDGSTDRTFDIVKKIRDSRIKLFRLQHAGIAEARNSALSISQGTYLAWLDSDDIAASDRLSRQVDFLEKNTNYGLCCANMIVIDVEGSKISKKVWPDHSPPVRWSLLWENPVAQSSVLLRKAIIERHHLRYETKYAPSEDYHFWCRFAQFSNMYRFEDALLFYRKIASSAFHSNMHNAMMRSLEANYAYVKSFVEVVPAYHKYCTFFDTSWSENSQIGDVKKIKAWVKEVEQGYHNRLTSTAEENAMIRIDKKRVLKSAIRRIEIAKSSEGVPWLTFWNAPGIFLSLRIRSLREVLHSFLRHLLKRILS